MALTEIERNVIRNRLGKLPREVYHAKSQTPVPPEELEDLEEELEEELNDIPEITPEGLVEILHGSLKQSSFIVDEILEKVDDKNTMAVLSEIKGRILADLKLLSTIIEKNQQKGQPDELLPEEESL